jgi:1-deoxy-D-xylulose-5-phosphate reductoisomerase
MESVKKRIAILGSTGSIGTQALEVIAAHPDKFEVTVLVAGNNVELLKEQALKFKPDTIVISNESHYKDLNDAMFSEGIKVYAGDAAVEQVMSHGDIDIVLTATVGFSGLKPTLAAIEAGKTIALANKETMVVAGDLVTKRAREKGVNILPVDSEHSAIFQSWAGEFDNPLEKIYLTASGGPFRGKTRKELEHVTRAQALKHPNWDMGAKITIDSASMMNKGLEVIEAYWLFGLKREQIDVIVHPQSIIHSIVQFRDGSMKAQMGLPDMKLPIQYALSYPQRLANDFKRFSFLDYPNLSFEKPDLEAFRNLQLAYDAMEKGGNMPCILNAANEIVVAAFLQDKIGFLEMSDVIEKVMNNSSFVLHPSLSDYLDSDAETRRKTLELIS